MSRFVVSYRIFASSLDEAADRAAGVALEQTVEIPRDVVPHGYVEDETIIDASLTLLAVWRTGSKGLI